MGRARIISHLGEAQYQVRYLYNVAAVEAEEQRLEERAEVIEAELRPQAEDELAAAEQALSDARAAVNTAIRKYEGQPTPEMQAEMAAAVSGIGTLRTTLDGVETGLLNVSVSVATSRAALPGGAPPSVIQAYDSLQNGITTAQSARNDEETSVAALQGTALEISNAIAGEPDMSSVRAQMATALDQLSQSQVEHSQAGARLADVATLLDAARNTLPSDPAYDTAREHLENAASALTTARASHSGMNYGSVSAALANADRLMQPGSETARQELMAALAQQNEASTAAQEATAALNELEAELQQINARLIELSQITREETKTVWCADYSTELQPETEVGTLEVPGELTETLVHPDQPNGKAGNAAWQPPRDGAMTPVQAMTPAQVFYNWCMAPGWQRFRPAFRFARVEAVNDDGTLKLAWLPPNTSKYSEHRSLLHGAPLDVTPKTLNDEEVKLDAVPVTYMDCHAGAFAAGDQVVVEFEGQKAEQPRVIGFRKQPRPCGGLIGTPSGITQFSGNRWTFAARSVSYGVVDWKGGAGNQVVSWHASSHRVCNQLRPPIRDDPGALRKSIYLGGRLIAEAPSEVTGAALQNIGTNAYLIAVSSQPEVDERYQMTGGKEVVYRKPLAGSSWETVGEIPWPSNWWTRENGVVPYQSVLYGLWHFNPAGTEAVSVRQLFTTRPGGGDNLELKAYKLTVHGSSVSMSEIGGADGLIAADYNLEGDGSLVVATFGPGARVNLPSYSFDLSRHFLAFLDLRYQIAVTVELTQGEGPYGTATLHTPLFSTPLASIDSLDFIYGREFSETNGTDESGYFFVFSGPFVPVADEGEFPKFHTIFQSNGGRILLNEFAWVAADKRGNFVVSLAPLLKGYTQANGVKVVHEYSDPLIRGFSRLGDVRQDIPEALVNNRPIGTI